MFVSTESITATHPSNSPAGYFRGVRGMELLVVEEGEKKWAIHLDPAGEQFTYYEVNGHWQEKGVTFADVRFDVDHASMIDTEYEGQPGDLIVSDAGLHVVAKQGSGFRGMIVTFALPGSEASATLPSVGFRRWRIVGGPAEEPVTLWPTDPSDD